MRKFIGMMILILLLPTALVGAQGDQDSDQPPVTPAITINSPAPGAVLPNLNAINVTGTGTALFENALVVQARDSGGAILAQQPVTTDASEVGGTGNWQATLAVNVTPGTAGDIRAFATSANDGSVIAEALINVIFGSSPQPSTITISTPLPGTILPNNGSFLVGGVAHNVSEGNVIVQARDAGGNTLAQQPTTADGSGNWQVSLAVNVVAGTTGSIRAYSESGDGRIEAEAIVNVAYGAIPVDVDIAITFPTNGATVTTAPNITVTGTTRNISDGRVVVQVKDGNNHVLAERQVQTAPTQGNGTWQALLNAFFTVNTNGSITAYTPGVGDGGQFLTDTIFVTFLANCAPRNDWPIYFVQRGDTLGNIARNVGSNTAELAQANCLNNINLIEVGQQIRVPRLPVVPTPVPARPAVTIALPRPGAVLDLNAPVTVLGGAAGLSTVTVQALDTVNNVLAAQTVAVAASGGWQASLNIPAVSGSTGRISAFGTASANGSVLASASVNVTYGQAAPGTVPTTTATMLQINVPQDEAVLNLNAPVTISGIGTGLFEGNVVVRVLDFEGNVLAEQPTTSPQGNWSLSLTLPADPGTRGIIYAYSPSPLDGSPQVVDAVNVVFGPAQPGPFVTLSVPLPYTLLDVETFKVSGRGGGLFEGNVVVRALDSAGNALVEQPTTLNAAEVGGAGEWEAELTVTVEPGTRGVIEASSASPADGSVIALARVPVTFGLPDPTMPFVHIVSPLPDSPLTAELGAAVSGYAGSLPTDTITVQIIDAQGNILASRSASVDAQSGQWVAPLTLAEVQVGTSGRLVAFASGPNGTVVASDGFSIQFAE